MSSIGCVVLTTGTRPDDLGLALDSLLAQEGVELDVVVVGNGWQPEGLPEGVRGVALAEDLGIPGGRNAGVPEVGGGLLFFLDDDASLAGPDALAQVAERFGQRPELGLLQLRVDPRGGGRPVRDWLPRLRVGDRTRSSELTAVWEGAVAIRRGLFDEVGGWPEAFRYVHEGIDLAWRVMDAGYRVEYAGDIAVLHPEPAPVPVRHAYSLYYGQRNKVWLARRHLPLFLGIPYAGLFAIRGLARARSAEGARTLLRMARAGRPPLV